MNLPTFCKYVALSAIAAMILGPWLGFLVSLPLTYWLEVKRQQKAQAYAARNLTAFEAMRAMRASDSGLEAHNIRRAQEIVDRMEAAKK